MVYILTNFNSAHEEDLERGRRVWEMGDGIYAICHDLRQAECAADYTAFAAVVQQAHYLCGSTI